MISVILRTLLGHQHGIKARDGGDEVTAAQQGAMPWCCSLPLETPQVFWLWEEAYS